jgi:hypothetical protein
MAILDPPFSILGLANYARLASESFLSILQTMLFSDLIEPI